VTVFQLIEAVADVLRDAHMKAQPPVAAWSEPADATDTGILVGIADSNNMLSARQRAYLRCVAWRLALLLDQKGDGRDYAGGTLVTDGLRRFITPPV